MTRVLFIRFYGSYKPFVVDGACHVCVIWHRVIQAHNLKLGTFNLENQMSEKLQN
jgi:hypothetical protein